MTEIIKQNRMVVWYQPSGKGTQWRPLGFGIASVTGRSNPGPGKTAVFGVNEFGQPVVLFSTKDPPGGLPAATIGFYDEAAVNYLEEQQAIGCPINLQVRTVKCGSLTNPNLWNAIDHLAAGLVGDLTPGDGPVRPYAGGAAELSGQVTFDYTFRIVKLKLQVLTTTEAENLTGIAVVDDPICDECGSGYPGPDKIIYITCAAGSGVTPNILYSNDGGGTFAASSANPFAADEDAGFPVYRWIDANKIRLITACTTTDAAALAKISYSDITLGAEGITAWTDVVSASASGANGDLVTAMFWPFFERLYIAVDDGQIYVSTDQGESWDDAAVFSGSNAIAAFATNYDGDVVWAVGATNTILRELNRSGTFDARVGPSGGGAFTAVAVANDGTLYAGNGTSIFKSVNDAENTGGWTSLKNFGSGYTVKKIKLTGGDKSLGGDSQIIRVWIDHATAGQVWESIDGGATWKQFSAKTNAGYNDAWSSRVNNNLNIGVGDASGGAGVIHKLAA